MTLKQMLEAMVYVVPIMAVLILIVFLIIRKQNKLKDILENSMTQAQKDRLLGTKAMPAPDGRSGFVTEALVVELQDKGEKLFVRLMWHNTVIPNNSYNQLMMAEAKVDKAQAEARNLRVGDYVTFWMDPEKQKWDILF